MEILIVRHAKAQDREKALDQGIFEADRALTAAGRRQFAREAKKQKKLFKGVSLFITSPYARAVQTLDILLDTLGLEAGSFVTYQGIKPEGNPKSALAWLKSLNEKKVVLVSHEPFISEFLKAAQGKSYKESKIKKGSVTRVKI